MGKKINSDGDRRFSLIGNKLNFISPRETLGMNSFVRFQTSDFFTKEFFPKVCSSSF